MPKWALSLPWGLISIASSKYNLDPLIIGAIVRQESAGRIAVSKFEKEYKWLSDPEKFARMNFVEFEMEVIHQKTSWGLMQIMGGTARSIGYKESLPKLIEPELNLEYGCRFLSYLVNKYGNIQDAISSYNQGSPRKNSVDYENQEYVDKVMSNYYEVKAE